MANNRDDFEEMYSSEEQNNGGSQEKEIAKKASKKLAKKAGEQVQNAGRYVLKLGGKAVTKVILAALPYIAIIMAVIIGIILLISVLAFIFSGPDMLRGQIVQMADELWTEIKTALVSVTKGDDYAEVADQHVLDVARYLEVMGFNVVNYGFVESESDVKRNEISNDGKSKKGTITEIKSNKIVEYLAAENRTYMLSTVSLNSIYRWWKGLDILSSGDNQTSSESNDAENSGLTTGMINLTTEISAVPEIEINGETIKWDDIKNEETNGTSGFNKYFGTTVNITMEPEVDRENRKLIINIKETASGVEISSTKCVYNLEGWTGRYGKPIEFLLALHLGTMSPEFAEAIATRKEFDTKVNIRLYKSVEVVRLKYNKKTLDELEKELNDKITEIWRWMQQQNAAARRTIYVYQNAVDRAQSEVGVTKAEIEDAKNYEKKNTKEKYTPYITSVENHWYRDLKFKDLTTASLDDAYIETYPSVVPSKYNKFDVYTYKSGEIYQVKEPTKSDVNETFEDLIINGLWEKVDGESGFIKTKETNTKIKSKITLGDDMKRAIVMIEKAAQTSDDAKLVVRDLKEWVTSKGIKFLDEKILTNTVTDNEEEGNINGSLTGGSSSSSTGGLTSSTTANSARLRELLGGKTAQILYDGNDAKIKTSEMPSGTGVYSVVGGTIEKVSNNAVQIKVTSPENLKDKVVIMSGIKMDPAIKEGDTVNYKTPIAETVSGNDMVIKMQDTSRNSISVKDNLK